MSGGTAAFDDDGLASDPRAIANLIIEIAGRPLSNLELQKLLYFCHAAYMVKNKRPLVTGNFEAWTFGPVHPAVYAAFKHFGADPITTRAERRDLRTGELKKIDFPSDREVIKEVSRTVSALSDLTAGQLVKLSHAKGAAWDIVFRRSKQGPMLGLRMSNQLIFEKYRNHWLSADQLTEVEEPHEDTPLAYHRLG